MSDPQAAEPTAPEPATVAESAVAAEPVVATPAEASAAPVAAEPAAAPAPAAPAPAPAKKRGVGIWAFVLALLVVLGDIVFAVFAAASLVGSSQQLLTALASGDAGALAGIAGFAAIALLFVVVLFGGLVLTGVAALLGIIALISGRGRVIGLFGLLLAAAALTWRIMLLTAGLNIGGIVGS